MSKRAKPVPLYDEIRTLVLSARQTIARGVDLLQVRTNYEIGRRIVEQEQHGKGRAEYGKDLLNDLSARLAGEFGSGFSRSNLEYMRRFYLAYPDRALPESQASLKSQVSLKSQTLSGKLSSESVKGAAGQKVLGQAGASLKSQTASGISLGIQSPFSLSWSHYVFLIGMKEAERDFYEIEATEQNWTLRELKRQFNAGLYERLALSRDKASIRELGRKGQHIARPEDLFKEPYVLEFLGLQEQAAYSESDLESAIVTHIERFLLELGKGFLFEARQKRFTFDEEHFFVDLVLYNRLLQCYVLIDLKIGKLTHQDLGQMQMYVNYFDRYVKTERENHTIGIVLCKKKNSALVRITLPADANIHAREYRLYLPSKEELREKLEEWADMQG
ncbi:Predicted nuclease of restriction endonuclease-like (RecB) superfamily, DUF1016 family [Granulicella rosea]|uniref:Predicted nuclease of restriction endonuclease-like (RecB) superfamily, DUF1016 family n=1 Tax=Granulicella rosea TaxID=474952 RepID=A0A239DVK5_9BACT|nr:PDDEXK nuclease domain-containing protein [Granulicella rosea]SNS36357.1 Predicted nuclease of restriction endonuclease-like (RecB) superfamily, DUF1016 family [Granulicella rosea]